MNLTMDGGGSAPPSAKKVKKKLYFLSNLNIFKIC